MARSPSAIKELVARELQEITQPDAVAALRDRLVEPRLEHFTWEYGAVGETRSCFVVAQDVARGTALVYCEDGFGPEDPWGYVQLAERSMGMDGQWFARLYDAAVAAGIALTWPGYQVP